VAYETIILDKDPRTHIAHLTLNRPNKVNAMSSQLCAEVIQAIAEIEQDDDIKVVILRGAGGNFSSGRDLSQVGHLWGSGEGKEKARSSRQSQRRRVVVDHATMGHYPAVFYCLKATIAAVEGYCLAGGFDFCMATDLQVVARDAKFGEPAERLVGPGLENNSLLYFWKLGPTLAKELLFTGAVKTGAELEKHNVFTKVVDASEVENEAERLAENIARMPADGIVMGKAAFNLVSDVMGMGLGYRFGKMWHSYQTNMRLEEDEFNFFRARRDHGVTRAMAMMREFFDAPTRR
jgi:enoyl-CoA hydratase